MTDNRHIKVLHIASGDLWAGAEAQLFTLATALQKTPDVDVSVVLLNYGKLEQKLSKAGVEVIVMDESRLNSFKILYQLVRTIKNTMPDVVHTHRTKENILGSIAARLSGNTPSLRTTHGASEYRPAWYHFPKHIIHFLDGFCGRCFQKTIVAVSEDLAGILHNSFPENKIKVIENGIDLTSISASTHHDTKAKGTGFKIGIAGRLVQVKRFDIFIRAAAKLKHNHPEIEASFHIYGDGPLHIELETLSRKLDIDHHVHFEGHCENMNQQLSSLDILLITSDHEGLPMILLEAMALKIPVIAHAVGGIPTVLKHGECGILVTEHNPSDYADAIFDLINNPTLRRHITHNAFSRVSTWYSGEKNAAAYHIEYMSLVAN